ncbi:MAG: ABC transporter ATP-binding protein [Schwartzia sp.]|nr:ABC transporter ATP-binding protein [Schwartzia sp. (in: firmicutes)]
MTTGRVTLRCAGLRKRFGRQELFGGLSFEGHGGEILAITGANGSGKSTLLKLAARLLIPDDGTVALCINDVPVAPEAYRSHFAMTAPEMNLYERLTAGENLRFFPSSRGLTLTDSEAKRLLDRVGLPAEAAGQPVGQFSTGMKQRLKLAIMMAAAAEVWLLDEPGANLDEAGRRMICREVQGAAREGRLVLWATNDSTEEGIADAVIRMGRGESRFPQGTDQRASL